MQRARAKEKLALEQTRGIQTPVVGRAFVGGRRIATKCPNGASKEILFPLQDSLPRQCQISDLGKKR